MSYTIETPLIDRLKTSADNPDELTAIFFSQDTKNQVIVQNITSYTLTSDFFVEPDAFAIEIEDDRVQQVIDNVAIGCQVQFFINLSTPVMFGYIDSMEVSGTRGGTGRKVSIRGRDILGLAQDATIRPNIAGNASNNFQFKPNSRFSSIIQTIFSDFSQIGSVVSNDDQFSQLTAATGFRTGIRRVGKTARGLQSSFNHSFQHIIKPVAHRSIHNAGYNHYESYLQYAKRLCDLAGFHLKMVPGSGTVGGPNNQTLFCGNPIYDRQDSSGQYGAASFQFSLIRSLDDNDSKKNNILSGGMKVSWINQPSVIIGEMTAGNGQYAKQNKKVICINELTGYVNGNNSTEVLQSVREFISDLQAQGYPTLEINQALRDAIPNSLANVQSNNICRPMWFGDEYAFDLQELKWKVAQRMSQFQEKFLTLNYEVYGHSQEGNVWQPNLMINVQDDIVDPNSSTAGKQYWIRKRVFTRTRGQGTRTALELSLPYVFCPNE